jgi:hypothetical protein
VQTVGVRTDGDGVLASQEDRERPVREQTGPRGRDLLDHRVQAVAADLQRRQGVDPAAPGLRVQLVVVELHVA